MNQKIKSSIKYLVLFGLLSVSILLNHNQIFINSSKLSNNYVSTKYVDYQLISNKEVVKLTKSSNCFNLSWEKPPGKFSVLLNNKDHLIRTEKHYNNIEVNFKFRNIYKNIFGIGILQYSANNVVVATNSATKKMNFSLSNYKDGFMYTNDKTKFELNSQTKNIDIYFGIYGYFENDIFEICNLEIRYY